MTFDLSRWLVVIPARLGSTRLPRKPLVDLGGKPLVVRVYESLAPLMAAGAEAIVATDAAEVMEVCRTHRIPAKLTDPKHESGTDRVAEVAADSARPFILNVQGDEPFLALADLQALCQALEAQPEVDIGTLVHACHDAKMCADPNAVKAVRGARGMALYFSRAPIPYVRDGGAAGALPLPFWLHIGVYAFRRERLLGFVQLPPSPLERSEKLEQLRALEQGWRIFLQPAAAAVRGIDTPADLEAARARFS